MHTGIIVESSEGARGTTNGGGTKENNAIDVECNAIRRAVFLSESGREQKNDSPETISTKERSSGRGKLTDSIPVRGYRRNVTVIGD